MNFETFIIDWKEFWKSEVFLDYHVAQPSLGTRSYLNRDFATKLI